MLSDQVRFVSVRLMGQLWGQEIYPSGKKFVLMAFADAANDDGICWLALESERGKLDIRTKTSLSVRAVQGHVATLEAEGWLERHETIGKGCIWRVNATPAVSAPTPADFALTPAVSAPTPAEVAGEPSTNRQLEKNPRERLKPIEGKCPVTGVPLPAGVSVEQWEAFLDMRASIAKPVRAYVATRLLSRLAEIGRMGWHLGDVIDRSTVNAWADLYEPEAGRVTGVRRIVAGTEVAEPVGMSDADRAELARIAQLPTGEMLAARREFMAQVERRNAPAPLGQMVGQLPLRPPVQSRRNNS